MHALQTTFIAVAVVGALYFCLFRRHFDFSTVSFLGAVFYCAPGFVGFAPVPIVSGSIYTFLPLEEQTYLVLITILASTVTAGVITALPFFRRPIPIALQGRRSALAVLSLLSAAAALLTAASIGDALLVASKRDLLSHLGIFFQVWVSCAMLLTAMSWACGAYGIFAFGLIQIVAFLFIGFRSPAVIVFLACSAISFFEEGPRRFVIAHIKFVGVTFVLLPVLFLYKYSIQLIRIGQFGNLADILSEGRLLVYGFFISEPFTQAGILNFIIKSRYLIEENYLIYGVIEQITLYSFFVGEQTKDFNKIFQPELFPYIQSGMASFFFAEAWSVMGWPGIVLYAFLFISGIVLFCRMLALRDRVLQGGCSVMAVYWVFYIHRNNLITQISFEKRLLLTILVIIIIGMLLDPLLRRRV